MPSKKKTLLIGFGIILSVFILIVLIWAGTFLPGFWGSTFRFIAGTLGTPLIMESFFGLLGLFIVLSLNSYRRQQDQDEYIPFDDIPKNLPSNDSDTSEKQP